MVSGGGRPFVEEPPTHQNSIPSVGLDEERQIYAKCQRKLQRNLGRCAELTFYRMTRSVSRYRTHPLYSVNNMLFIRTIPHERHIRMSVGID